MSRPAGLALGATVLAQAGVGKCDAKGSPRVQFGTLRPGPPPLPRLRFA